MVAPMGCDGGPPERIGAGRSERGWQHSARAEGRHAESVEVDHLDATAVLPSDLIGRIDGELEFPERHVERIEDEEPADHRLTDPEDEFECLECLQAADDAREHAEYASFGARRRKLRRRGFGEEISVGGAMPGIEHADLPLETKDRPVNHRNPGLHRRIVEEVSSRKVVGPVDDHVVAVDDLHHVGSIESDIVSDDRHIGIECLDRRSRRVDLSRSNLIEAMDDLPLQILCIDLVHVDDPDRADTGCCEIEGNRRTEATRTEDEHPSVEQRQLPLLPHLRKQEVPLITISS